MKFIYRFKYFLPAIIVAFGIFVASHQTYIKLPDLGFNFTDKILHLLAYLVFGFTLNIAVKKNFPVMGTSNRIIVVLVLGSIYALSDEVHQYFIPGRTCDMLDWAADCFGIIVAVVLASKIKIAGSHA